MSTEGPSAHGRAEVIARVFRPALLGRSLPQWLLVSCGVLSASCGPSDLAGNVDRPGPLSGDFAVSDHFTASGFMGDGETSGFLSVRRDEGCPARPAGAEGSCFVFRYQPGESRWAGVYFQYPANNWGSQPGRDIAGSYEKVRFSAAARYSIVLPAGGGIGGACAAPSDCRPGLGCEAGRCAPSRVTPEGERCLVSAECSGQAQCIAQKCAPAGAAAAGQACGVGDDARCAAGLRCGLAENQFRCVADGSGDVEEPCSSMNDCRAGLTCEARACVPKTLLGPVRFMVGGIQPTKASLTYADEIGVEYFALGGAAPPMLSPELRRFELDLGGQSFDSLIGAFMWAAAFPDIDVTAVSGAAPYLADPSRPAYLYFDDIAFEAAPPRGGSTP